MKNSAKTIVATIVVIIVVIIAVVGANAEVVATVRDYSNPEYSVPLEKFDLETIKENSTLYIEWKDAEILDHLDLKFFAWRSEDGQLLLTHSGLEWWLSSRGFTTQNYGGTRWGTYQTPEGMFFFDICTDVELRIPYAEGTDYAVTAAEVEAVLHQAGLI